MRKYDSFSLLACALLILSSSYFVLDVNAETLTLNPIEDSYVEDVNPSDNHGGQSYLQVSNSGNMFTGECLAFLKFDLSTIPAGVSADSAKLKLYTSIYVSATRHISAHYSSDNTWKELEITYNNHPSFNTTATSTTPVASTNTWYEWTVTTDVQKALGTADRKITIVMSCEYYEAADWVWFESKDQEYSWMEEYIPKLEVSYISKVDTPAFSPAGGTYSSVQNVALSCATSGATIRYTTDGSEPSSSSTAYTAPIVVNTNITVEAKAFKEGMADSDTASADYTIILPTTKVSTPTFSPGAGSYSSAQSISIQCATSGATIRYTTDGSEPSSSSTAYSGLISVSSTTTIKTKAFMSGMTDSNTATATYTITTPSSDEQPFGECVIYAIVGAVAIIALVGGVLYLKKRKK